MAALEQLEKSLERIVELENEVNMLTARMDQIQHAMDMEPRRNAAALRAHNELKTYRRSVKGRLTRAKSHHGGSRKSPKQGCKKTRRRR